MDAASSGAALESDAGTPAVPVVEGDGLPGQGTDPTSRTSSAQRRRSSIGSPKGRRASSRRRSSALLGHSKRSKGRRDDDFDEDAGEASDDEDVVADEKIQGFMDDVFKEYATCHDNQRRPLMTCPDLRRYFRDMFGEEKALKARAKADLSYDIFLERQVDMSFRFDLAKGEAKRGLTLMTFQALINEVLPRGASRRAALERFGDFAGDAKAMKTALDVY